MRIFLFLLIYCSFLPSIYSIVITDSKEKIKNVKIRHYSKKIYAPNDVIFFDEDLKSLNLELYEGKSVLVVFWATWCFSCTSKMKDLDILKKDFRKLQFDILPISEDTKGLEVIKDFYNSHNIKHIPILLDDKNKLMRSMDINTLPTALLLDEDGRIIYEFIGSIDWRSDEVRELILSVIPGKPSMPRNTYKDGSLHF